MSLAQAITTISGWSVTGVTSNFNFSTFTGRLNIEDLPALVLMFGKHQALGFEEATLGGDNIIYVPMAHYLIQRGVGMGDNRIDDNELVTLLDNYMTKLGADPTLSGYLRYPAQVKLAGAAPIDLGGVRWRGLTFMHTWAVSF